MSVTVMKMNLRGVYFEVNVDLLDRAKLSRLARLSDGEEKVPLDSRGCYFYDRNPDVFQYVLDYYSSGVLDIPAQYSWRQAKDELDFWEIEEKDLSEACRVRYHEEKLFMKKVEEVTVFEDRHARLMETAQCKGLAQRAKPIWELLELPRSSKLSMVYSVFMYVVVPYLSLVNAFFHTLPHFAEFEHHVDNTTGEVHMHHIHIDNDKGKIIRIIKLTTTVMFVLELVVRFVVWPDKRRFFCVSFNWFDIIGFGGPIVHGIMGKLLFESHEQEQSPYVVMLSHFFLALCAFRAFRVFRLWQAFDTYKVLMLAIKYTVPHFLLCFCVMRAFVELIGFLVYASQSHVKDTEFTSAFKGGWFASSMLTTLGIGDILPETTLGRWMAHLSEGLGVLMLAFPVVAFVNNYRLASRVISTARLLHLKQDTKEMSPA